MLNATEPVSTGREVAQAVSVAAAYFEDTLGGAPSGGAGGGHAGRGATSGACCRMNGMEGMRVREMVESAAMAAGCRRMVPVPRGLAGGRAGSAEELMRIRSISRPGRLWSCGRCSRGCGWRWRCWRCWRWGLGSGCTR